MDVIIRGTRIKNADITQCLQGLAQMLNDDLAAADIELRLVITALQKLSACLLLDTAFLTQALCGMGLTVQQAQSAKEEAAQIISEQELYKKVKRELSAFPGDITRRTPREPFFEGYMPLGVLGHVTSSNDAMLPFLSAVEGLLSGNINLIKTASGASDVAMQLIEKLCSLEPLLCPYLYVFPLSSRQTDYLQSLFACCDAVAVWGSDAAVQGVRRLAPQGVEIISWGHRISFAYVTERGNTQKALEGIAADVCCNDQQACSAPQVVYYECETHAQLKAFADKLFMAMEAVTNAFPQGPLSESDCAELTARTEMEALSELMGDGYLLCGKNFRIFTQFDSALVPSPLFRTILLKPIKRTEIIKTLRPFSCYLQSVGLSCAVEEVYTLTRLLLRAGASRVVSAGQMMSGYTGQPHDGVYALSRYVKRISTENEAFPRGVMSLDEMAENKTAPFKPGTPVLKKADFKEAKVPNGKGLLVLKSGGSSGKAVYAPHTYSDAQLTYETTGRAVIAAGVDPKQDICMNLFYGGSMYGGFISIYEALKAVDVTQLPMGAEMDLDFVMNEIENNRANVLLGMPTYLIRLFSEQAERIQRYGGIKKVFYGGESFDPAQIKHLHTQFGVSVSSLVYGCNEIGAIGYACPHCTGTQHHLLSSKYMEILKTDSDKPAAIGETGRIVLTPVNRENTCVERYEIGDLGRFLEEPCPCGRQAVRFELMGRFGDTFKFATNYIHYIKIKKILAKYAGYTGWLQVVLSYDGSSVMELWMEEKTENAVALLRAQYPEIEECMRDRTGRVTAVLKSRDAFYISSGGGKVRNVVDLRNV